MILCIVFFLLYAYPSSLSCQFNQWVSDLLKLTVLQCQPLSPIQACQWCLFQHYCITILYYYCTTIWKRQPALAWCGKDVTIIIITFLFIMNTIYSSTCAWLGKASITTSPVVGSGFTCCCPPPPRLCCSHWKCTRLEFLRVLLY